MACVQYDLAGATSSALTIERAQVRLPLYPWPQRQAAPFQNPPQAFAKGEAPRPFCPIRADLGAVTL